MPPLMQSRVQMPVKRRKLQHPRKERRKLLLLMLMLMKVTRRRRSWSS
jgi:hypothetical protein